MRTALRGVDRLFRAGTGAGLGDDRLIERFLTRGDDEAFGLLVERHGPLVLRAAVDLARDRADAEDAFQATFLTLARRAGTIRGRESIGPWLHRVACRQARRLNARSARRREREQRCAATAADPGLHPVERDELREAIHDEVDRLPESYRRPVVLCLLGDLPQAEAATRLKLSEGSVRGRLARARALLRERLERRGFGPASGLTLGLPALAVPEGWVASAVAGASVASAARRGLWLVRPLMTLMVAAGLAVAASFVTPGAGGASSTVSDPRHSKAASPAPTPRPLTPAKEDAGKPVVIRGRVLGPDGKPVAGARVFLTRDARPWGDERARTGADGSYHFELSRKAFQADFPDRLDPGSGATRYLPSATLVAQADGHGFAWANLDGGVRPAATGAEYVTDLRLVADRPITGRLVDKNGVPAVGASVRVTGLSVLDGDWKDSSDALLYHKLTLGPFPGQGQRKPGQAPPFPRLLGANHPLTLTDAAGRFRIEGVGRDRGARLAIEGPGIVSLRDVTVITRDDAETFVRPIREKFPRVRWPDGINEENPWAMRSESELVYGPSFDLEVDPARTVGGTVRDDGTGEPLVGISVHVAAAPGFLGGSPVVRTDARGRYHLLRHDDWADVWVTAATIDNHRGTHEYLGAAVKLEDAHGLGHQVADFALRRGVVVTGKVVEAGTGRPIVSAPRPADGTPGPSNAGFLSYRPLAGNKALRGTPSGNAFEAECWGGSEERVAEIFADGTFRITVPPGPGVLLVRGRPGLPQGRDLSLKPWDETTGRHRLYPYAPLTGRRPDDGAPATTDGRLDGYSSPVPLLDDYHAYRVIDPPADARGLAVAIDVPRAAERLLRFVDPAGKPVAGVTALGLLPWPNPAVILHGSEGFATGLDPKRPRPLLVLSNDGEFSARTEIPADVTTPLAVRLEPTGSVTARLVDAKGDPLDSVIVRVGYDVPGYPLASWMVNTQNDFVPRPEQDWPKTDLEGKVRVVGIVPGLKVSIWFQEKFGRPQFFRMWEFRPAALQHVVFGPGGTIDLGEVVPKFSPGGR